MAIPLARMIWDPWQAGPVAQLLDPETPQAEEASPALTQRIVQPLFDLPPQTPLADISAHLTALSQHVTALDLYRALSPAAHQGTTVARNALILLATEPASDTLLQGSGALRDAYAVAENESDALHLWATSAASLMQAIPAARADCPPAATLIGKANAVGEPTAAALRAIATQLDHAG